MKFIKKEKLREETKLNKKMALHTLRVDSITDLRLSSIEMENRRESKNLYIIVKPKGLVGSQRSSYVKIFIN